MKVKVYSLLTLERDAIRRVLPRAIVAAPIQRGDIAADIAKKMNVLVIIDGSFQDALAVSPADILNALRAGIRVYGASSMGALRAVEMESLGMIGVGRVFEHIKAHPYFRDDFLGQAFDFEEHDAFSTSYMDFILGLEALHRQKKIDRRTLTILDQTCAELHFSDRNVHSLIAAVRKKYPKNHRLAGTIRTMFATLKSTKRADAIEALKSVKRDLDEIGRCNAEIWRRQSLRIALDS